MFAVDATGTSVVDAVSYDDKVDRNVLGNYEVSYRLKEEEENNTIEKNLTVHIS